MVLHIKKSAKVLINPIHSNYIRKLKNAVNSNIVISLTCSKPTFFIQINLILGFTSDKH